MALPSNHGTALMAIESCAQYARGGFAACSIVLTHARQDFSVSLLKLSPDEQAARAVGEAVKYHLVVPLS